MLIPGMIDGQQYTIKKLEKLIKEKYLKEGINKIPIVLTKVFMRDFELDEVIPNDKSRWILMTSIIDLDNEIQFGDENKFIEQHSQKRYRLPRILEVASCVFGEFARSGKILARNFSSTCQEKRQSKQILVVTYWPPKFYIDGDDNFNEDRRLAAVREL